MSMFGTTACSVKGRCETLLRLRRPSAVADVIGMGLPTAVSTKPSDAYIQFESL